MPTTDHQFGASNIDRLNLLFLQLKDKREVGESWYRSGLVVEGSKAGLRVGPGGDADCPVWAQEQGSERPAGSAGALGPRAQLCHPPTPPGRPAHSSISHLALSSPACKGRADPLGQSVGVNTPTGGPGTLGRCVTQKRDPKCVGSFPHSGSLGFLGCWTGVTLSLL